MCLFRSLEKPTPAPQPASDPSLTPVPEQEESVRYLHAQYDWTTGVPDNGNEWRMFRAVLRSHPLRPRVCTFSSRGGERRACKLRGKGGDHVHCMVEPWLGNIRCCKLIRGTF